MEAHPRLEARSQDAEVKAAERLLAARAALDAAVGRVIIGQETVRELLLVALLSSGHALLVGVPGLAKTLLVHALANALDCRFRRIQFTPDLMPTDITGTEVIEEDPDTGRRRLRFLPGPLFTHVLLADELNRTPPKPQAALLQAMQEREVTAGGTTHLLEDPFFAFAHHARQLQRRAPAQPLVCRPASRAECRHRARRSTRWLAQFRDSPGHH